MGFRSAIRMQMAPVFFRLSWCMCPTSPNVQTLKHPDLVHFWDVGSVLICMGHDTGKWSAIKLWPFPWRTGQCRDRQLSVSILCRSPDSSAEQYCPNMDPGTVLNHCSLQMDCHLPLSARTFQIQKAKLQLTSACLLEMNTCNQKKIGSMSSEDTRLGIKRYFRTVLEVCFNLGPAIPEVGLSSPIINHRQFGVSYNSSLKTGFKFKQLPHT